MDGPVLEGDKRNISWYLSSWYRLYRESEAGGGVELVDLQRRLHLVEICLQH